MLFSGLSNVIKNLFHFWKTFFSKKIKNHTVTHDEIKRQT